MRILQVISSGGMYGAEAVILNLSTALNSSGENVSIIGVFENSEHPNLELHRAAERAGLEAHIITCRGQLDLSVTSHLRRLAQTLRADVVHAHGYKADIYTRWAFRRSPIAMVATCHNWIDNGTALRVYGWLDRRSLRRFQRIAAVSQAVRARLLASGVVAERVKLIPNGIAAAHGEASGCSPRTGALTVGLVGRLSPEKGIDVFLHAADQVRRHGAPVRFVIAGEGPERPRIESLIRDLRLEDHVTLPGRCEDMDSIYRSLDLLVIASHTEGLPVVLLEGMAHGLPVVATRVGDIPSVLQDGYSGLLVPPGDADGLATAMTNLLTDAGRRCEMGENARRRVSMDFSASTMCERYLQLYNEALAAKRMHS